MLPYAQNINHFDGAILKYCDFWYSKDIISSGRGWLDIRGSGCFPKVYAFQPLLGARRVLLHVKGELPTNIIGIKGAMEVYGEILKEGFGVYVPLMYTGHDCIIKKEGGGHIDVEIKTRTDGTNFSVGGLRPRPDFFIACHYDGTQETWIFPSADFVKHSLHIKKIDRHTLVLSAKKKEELHPFYRAFHLLKLPVGGKAAEPPHAEAPKGRRVHGTHFKQPDYEKEILGILSAESGPLSSREIIAKVKMKMASKFSKADLVPTSRGRPRWEATARFAIYQGLKKRRLIQAVTKNQWTITPDGRAALIGT